MYVYICMYTVMVSTIFLGGLGILRLLSILDSRVVSLIVDILHFLSSCESLTLLSASLTRKHVLVSEKNTHYKSLITSCFLSFSIDQWISVLYSLFVENRNSFIKNKKITISVDKPLPREPPILMWELTN